MSDGKVRKGTKGDDTFSTIKLCQGEPVKTKTTDTKNHSIGSLMTVLVTVSQD